MSALQPVLAGYSEYQNVGRVKYNTNENIATIGSNGYNFSFVGRGGTPFYTFSDPTNRTYFVKFMKLIEFTDENGDGKFDPEEAIPGRKYSLPSADWRFTVNETDQTFKFSTQDSVKSPSISFINQYADAQPERLKFDIWISNWTWYNASNSNMLAMQFDVLPENESLSHTLKNGIEFDENAYFESSDRARFDGEEASVGISIKENSVFLAYSHFDILEHDPIIGFRGVPVMIPGVTGGLTITDYSYVVLVATAIMITVVYSRRR